MGAGQRPAVKVKFGHVSITGWHGDRPGMMNFKIEKSYKAADATIKSTGNLGKVDLRDLHIALSRLLVTLVTVEGSLNAQSAPQPPGAPPQQYTQQQLPPQQYQQAPPSQAPPQQQQPPSGYTPQAPQGDQLDGLPF